ncbi:hypothetical protein SPI_08844 [Niveomyces insectorum RCEF 264]|uniref:Uncharacterized protein n=1 Tax=Niveomyces insectorum RCEF 264 TaxID=1081102 RepID=A0A167MP47_9HYPO|nr:hypothetical protein SPI_08844 [Niveomyces insectorum RCEF 264]
MDSSRPRGLLDLPTEILVEIFRTFCLHCWYGDRHDHGEEALVSLDRDMFEVGRQGRAVLAKISRTCKALAPIAQPLLFHFFHTGNQPRMLESNHWDDVSFRPGSADDDMLLPFIRTLLDRPDLAVHVRALALYHAMPVRAAAAADRNLMARIRAMILQQLFREADLQQYGDDLRPFGDDFHLHDVVIALSPNVEQLLLGGIGTPKVYDEAGNVAMIGRGNRTQRYEEWPGSGPVLHRLRYAAFVTTPTESAPYRRGRYHMLMLEPLVGRAPNLEMLLAADAGHSQSSHFWMRREPWTTAPLMHLRTMCVSGVGPEILCGVFACCPALEDLSYWVDADAADFEGYRSDLTLLTEDHMVPLYPSLRRLCYSYVESRYYTPQWAQRVAEEDGPLGWSGPERASNRDPYVSFRRFARLAILEVEHVLFNGGDEAITSPGPHQGRTQHARDCVPETTPRRLLEALPASLQVLHIGFVINWIDFYHDMEALALGAAKNVPLLRIVRADCVALPPEEEVDDLVMLLGAVGIRFCVGETHKGDGVRGMMDDRPGHPYGTQDPVFSYGLHCLEKLV